MALARAEGSPALPGSFRVPGGQGTGPWWRKRQSCFQRGQAPALSPEMLQPPPHIVLAAVSWEAVGTPRVADVRQEVPRSLKPRVETAARTTSP